MRIILIAFLLIESTFLYAEANQCSQNTYTKCLLKRYTEIKKIEITFNTLREINIFYPREDVLRKLLNRYGNE